MRETSYARLVYLLSIVAIVAGIAARVVDFGNMPPGLNQDEASNGYDAWTLFHYGTDAAGISWPVHRIAFGDGGNTTYAYMVMPFMAFGLSPLTVRLPMLLSGLATVFLVWFVCGRLFGERAAWSSAAVVALSPWHIMLSRWGLDCNILPFLFLSGLALLVVSVKADRKQLWLIAACAMLGVSVYSYGTAYLAVPLFVLGSLIICVAGGIYTKRQAVVSAVVFGVTALPMALYVAVNLFHWNSIVVGGITIARLPTPPRFETQLAAGPLAHIGEFVRLLVTQRDGTSYNVTDPYGVVYSSIFMALAAGVVIAIPILVARRKWPVVCLFLPLWILACVPTGILQQPNINRVNLLLMGLVVSAGVAIAVIDKWIRGALIVGLVSLLTFFGFFVRDYFTTQRERIAFDFFDGLLPALSYAQAHSDKDGRICVTSQVNMPQLYALVTEPLDPREYQRTLRYVDPNAQFRQIASYGRYTFGLERCNFEQTELIIARRGEHVSPPFSPLRSFASFEVYALGSTVSRN